jgi:hypothetical protein
MPFSFCQSSSFSSGVLLLPPSSAVSHLFKLLDAQSSSAKEKVSLCCFQLCLDSATHRNLHEETSRRVLEDVHRTPSYLGISQMRHHPCFFQYAI